jgi:hypothetical protein
MLDTIIFNYLRSDYLSIEAFNKDYNLLKRTLNVSTTVIRKTNPQNGAEEQFELKEFDLLLRKFENHFILSVSLWKFYKGSNLKSFDLLEVTSALKKLSSFLGFRIEKGVLQRIDLAQNFEMERHCREYIQNIQKPCAMEWLYDYTGRSIAFTNRSRNRQIVIYSKLGQGQVSHNVLRYEYRFKRQLRHSINWCRSKAKLKGAHLFSTTFRICLLNHWFKGFCKLDFPHEPIADSLSGKGGYKDYLIAEAIKAKGLETCYREIDNLNSGNGKLMSASSKSKLRRELRELATNEEISQSPPLVKELRSKVARRFLALKAQQESAIFSARE